MIQTLSSVLSTINDYLYGYVLVYLLVGVGFGLTIYLGGVQFRHLGAIFKSISNSRSGAGGGISSFQAFAIGVATRVGIGNIGGVALALIIGGPGAIFWMWVVAIIGMATSFAESTLAQIFKVRHHDGTFRGGPAYYISRGLGWRKFGMIFAGITVFASGLAVPMVQINTVAATFKETTSLPTWVTAIIVVALLAPVILGGVRWVARVSEIVAPVMAIVYVAITVLVIVTNLPSAGAAFAMIFKYAFGFQALGGGIFAGIWVAVLNGARRGLFSNEAGLGTSPNAAGSATVSHPVNQGFIQSLGVFIDTIIVCTATALLILIAGKDVYDPTIQNDPSMAGSLTATAVIHELGPFMAIPMALIIFVFGYSSAFGAWSYGQVALDHITDRAAISVGYRILALAVCGLGAVAELATVWALSDVLLGLGAILNLVALVFLAKWVRAALNDWRVQRGAGVSDPVFIGEGNALLPRDVSGLVWAKRRY